MIRIIGFLAGAGIAALPAARAQSADQERLQGLQINPNLPSISDVAFLPLASPPLTIAGLPHVDASLSRAATVRFFERVFGIRPSSRDSQASE